MRYIRHDIKIGSLKVTINCIIYSSIKNQGNMSIEVKDNKGYEYYIRECMYYKTIRDIVNAIIRLKKSEYKMTEKRLKNWCETI